MQPPSVRPQSRVISLSAQPSDDAESPLNSLTPQMTKTLSLNNPPPLSPERPQPVTKTITRNGLRT